MRCKLCKEEGNEREFRRSLHNIGNLNRMADVVENF